MVSNVPVAHLLWFNLYPILVIDDREETDDGQILTELENIDDELDAQGIHIVKIADDVAAREYGIEDTPCLVYFEKEVRTGFVRLAVICTSVCLLMFAYVFLYC